MPESRKRRVPMGETLEKNLVRLGWASTKVRVSEIAKAVEDRTGKSVTKQRISGLLNAIFIESKTIKWLAEGLGVKPEELTKEEPK